MPSMDIMGLGTGFWCMNRRGYDQTLYLDGLVQKAAYGIPIHVNAGKRWLHMLAQPFATDLALVESEVDLWAFDGSKAKGSVTGTESDEIWFYDQAGDTYQKNWLYEFMMGDPYNGVWFDSEMAMPTSDIWERGEGVWFMSTPDPGRAGTPSWIWTPPVPY